MVTPGKELDVTSVKHVYSPRSADCKGVNCIGREAVGEVMLWLSTSVPLGPIHVISAVAVTSGGVATMQSSVRVSPSMTAEGVVETVRLTGMAAGCGLAIICSNC